MTSRTTLISFLFLVFSSSLMAAEPAATIKALGTKTMEFRREGLRPVQAGENHVVNGEAELGRRWVLQDDYEGVEQYPNHEKMHQNARAYKDLQPPQSKAEYIEKSDLKHYFKMLLYNPENHLSFNNPNGKLGIGTCWWHSYFQRNATYLTYFSPAKPKPTTSEAANLIRRIRTLEGPTEIPGYANLKAFSTDHKALIESELGNWQIKDSVSIWAPLRGAFGGIVGDREAAGHYTLDGNLRYAYAESKKGHIVFQVLQMAGPAAHSWVIVDIERMQEGKKTTGYYLHVVDSNEAEVVREYQTVFGQKQLRLAYAAEEYADPSVWFNPTSFTRENQNFVVEKIDLFRRANSP